MKKQAAGTRAALLAPLLLLGVLAGGAVHGQTYSWRDDDGSLVFSQIPPPDSRPVRRVRPPPPPAESPAAARARLQQKMRDFADRREVEQINAQMARQRQAEAARAAESCRRARHNLQGLRGGNYQVFRNSQGQLTRYTPAERAARIREQEAIAGRDCR